MIAGISGFDEPSRFARSVPTRLLLDRTRNIGGNVPKGKITSGIVYLIVGPAQAEAALAVLEERSP